MWPLLVPVGRGGASGKALAVGAAPRAGGAEGVLQPACKLVLLPSIPIALKTLDKLEKEIYAAPNFESLDKASRTAAGLQTAFNGVKEVSDRAGEVWIEAECKLDEELAKIGKATGAEHGGFLGLYMAQQQGFLLDNELLTYADPAARMT